MKFQTIKDIILIAEFFIIGIIIVIFSNTKGNYEDKTIQQQEQIKQLKVEVAKQELVKQREIEYREELRYLDSITITNLKNLKRRDSLNQVRTIKELVNKYKGFSEQKLDSLLIKAYEDYISNH